MSECDNMHTLKIKDLNVEIDGKKIIQDFNLTINSKEIHVIMGPNGIGKSTLTKVIMGDPSYKITKGTIEYDGKKINNLKTDERARLGIFLSMQNPSEIEGVTNADFLKAAVSKKQENFKLLPFVKEVNELYKEFNMDTNMTNRPLNVGFSGGEKKKNEIIQMYLLKPSLILLDEVDSGLDVDSLKLVGEKIMEYYQKEECAILLITHYQRLLDYIKPDFVHIMKQGSIIKSGDNSLVAEVEKKGYNAFTKEDENE